MLSIKKYLLYTECEFKCRNGNCIMKGWGNDGRDDCGDCSDEDRCSHYKF